MNKLQSLLLNDYIKDTNPVRLELFVNSINPTYILTKKNTAQLIQLIADYKLDTNKQRLKVLTNYLQTVNPVETKRFKPSQLKNPTPEIAAVIKKTNKEKSEIEKKEELLTTYKRSPNWNQNAVLLEKITNLTNELTELYAERGDYLIKPPEVTWFAIINGLFGHWDDPNSIAYKLINQTEPRITVNSGMNPDIMIAWLEHLSGGKIKDNYYCQTNKGYGVQSGNFTEKMIFTNKHSNLPLIKENRVSINIDSAGNQTEDENGMAGGMFNNMPSIPGIGKTIDVAYTAPVANNPVKNKLIS